MKIMRFYIILFTSILLLTTSCSEAPDDNNSADKGAKVPFIKYEAENSLIGGGAQFSQGKDYRTPEGEASGKATVLLNETGQYVEFVLTKPANAFVLRYAMENKDTDANGGTSRGNLDILVNGNKIKELPTSSQFAAVYGRYPFDHNMDGEGGRIRFYDDVRILLGQTYMAGTAVRIQKTNDGVNWYHIDFAEFEIAPEALSPPSGNYINIIDHGGNGNGITDNRTALVSAMTAARNAGHRTVWIPPGTYNFIWNGNIDANGIRIFGAGIWHTTLTGSPYFFVRGSNNHFKDFSIFGSVTRRIDSDRHCAFEPLNSSGDIYENLWLEHVKCGIWAVNMQNSIIRNNRIRNNYADGINLASGSKNNTIEHNEIRNHGDDGIAINSENGHHNTGNIIKNNTVSLTYHASLLAVYGGGNNTLQDNLLYDTIAFGSAINISSRFDPRGFDGITTITGNTAFRTGSAAVNTERNRNNGAIWLIAWGKDFGSGTINITDNRLIDCLYDGITIDGTRAINNNVIFLNNRIEGANGYGVLIHGGNNTLSGSATFTNTKVTEASSGAFRNNRTQFTVHNGGGNSW